MQQTFHSYAIEMAEQIQTKLREKVRSDHTDVKTADLWAYDCNGTGYDCVVRKVLNKENPVSNTLLTLLRGCDVDVYGLTEAEVKQDLNGISRIHYELELVPKIWGFGHPIFEDGSFSVINIVV